MVVTKIRMWEDKIIVDCKDLDGEVTLNKMAFKMELSDGLFSTMHYCLAI